jgi:hypothetical protein
MKLDGKIAAIILFSLVLIIGSTSFPRANEATTQATPTTSSVTIDGQAYDFDAYNIGGFNYFKLRDLAYVLTDTLKPFSVGWDVDAEIITLKTNEQYTQTGGELEINPAPSVKEAFPSSHKLLLNGDFITCEAFTIDGLNYFKLRDIGEKIDFLILWDEANNYILIDTSYGYDQEADLAEPADPASTELAPTAAPTLTPTPTKPAPDPADPTEPDDPAYPEPDEDEDILPPDQILIAGRYYDPMEEYLFLFDVALSDADLRNLSLFPYLVDLDIEDCVVQDITPLSELENLESLYLSGTQVKDVSSLSRLRNLVILDLNSNEITEVSLTGLHNLEMLHLSENQITKVSLSGMPKLNLLVMNDNQIEEISLSGLDKLALVDMSSNPIKDLSALTELHNLIGLAVSSGDIDSIRKLTQLEELYMVNVALDEQQIQELETALPSCLIEYEDF